MQICSVKTVGPRGSTDPFRERDLRLILKNNSLSWLIILTLLCDELKWKVTIHWSDNFNPIYVLLRPLTLPWQAILPSVQKLLKRPVILCHIIACMHTNKWLFGWTTIRKENRKSTLRWRNNWKRCGKCNKEMVSVWYNAEYWITCLFKRIRSHKTIAA